MKQSNRRIACNSAEFTLRLSSWRFHERYCRPNLRRKKALENIMSSRACLVAGTCNHLKLGISELYSVLGPLAPASKNGLFRAAA
jgi:hypothetical protein